MGQAQINVRTRACSRASIARTKQAALTHNVRGKELSPVGSMIHPNQQDKSRASKSPDFSGDLPIFDKIMKISRF